MEIETRYSALVVDDDVSVRLMLQKVLERQGFGVDSAKDGVEALERISEKPYDVIFLDLMMPRVDGTAVVRYLKANAPDALKSVIIMTAFTKIVTDSTDDDGFERVIAKPVDINNLVANALEMIAAARAPQVVAMPATVLNAS